MSGFSDGGPCPNCGKGADIYIDWKPFSYTSITCSYCGLMINPQIEYMTLEELNEHRENNEMRKLKKLPKQDKDLW